jgi:hypothetical protein
MALWAWYKSLSTSFLPLLLRQGRFVSCSCPPTMNRTFADRDSHAVPLQALQPLVDDADGPLDLPVLWTGQRRGAVSLHFTWVCVVASCNCSFFFSPCLFSLVEAKLRQVPGEQEQPAGDVRRVRPPHAHPLYALLRDLPPARSRHLLERQEGRSLLSAVVLAPLSCPCFSLVPMLLASTLTISRA